MIDLQTRTQAALLQMLRRILAHPNLGAAAFLRHVLAVEDLTEEFRTKPLRIHRSMINLPYYHSMLKLWFQFHAFYPVEETTIRQEALWGNKWITTAKGPLQNQHWKSNGIRVIQDICHPSEGRLLSHVEVQEKYRIKCTFLEMLSVRLSIPLAWRQALSRDWVLPPIFPGGPLLHFPEQNTEEIRNISPKKAYSLLLSAKNIVSVAFHRWTRNGHPPSIKDKEEWNRVCRRAYITTKETKLQSLQFKIIHAVTPCRKYLRQIRVVEDESCTWCGEVDDINHFFFLCPRIKTFWTSLSQWLAQQANINLNQITPKEAIFGVDDQSIRGKITNFILLHFRFYIHRQRLFHDSKFELTHWLSELRLRLRCLRNNLQQEGKIRHFRSWNHLLQALG